MTLGQWNLRVVDEKMPHVRSCLKSPSLTTRPCHFANFDRAWAISDTHDLRRI